MHCLPGKRPRADPVYSSFLRYHNSGAGTWERSRKEYGISLRVFAFYFDATPEGSRGPKVVFNPLVHP